MKRLKKYTKFIGIRVSKEMEAQLIKTAHNQNKNVAEFIKEIIDKYFLEAHDTA